jgi:hypothetical protein
MSTLPTLPKELLLQILSFLPLPDIESVAQTYNYQITPACLPSLTPLFARRRHIKAMTTQFGSFKFTSVFNFTRMVEQATTYNLSPEETRHIRQPSNAEMPYLMERLDWVFNFTDQLTWLASTPKGTRRGPTAVPYSAITALEIKLGVTLPLAFSTLYTTQNLLDRIHVTMTPYLVTSFNVRKVPAAITNRGGYVLPIYNSDRYRSCWAMYISPEGAHCMLATGRPVTSPHRAEHGAATMDEHARANMEGMLMAGMLVEEVEFHGVGFAEWLAMMCFERGVRSAMTSDGEVYAALEEYIRAIYVTGNNIVVAS